MNQNEAMTESTAAEAINAATVAAEAVERARKAQADASQVNTTKALSDALRDVFGEHTASGRFIDVSRIPLICKSIFDTNERMKRIEAMITDQKTALDKKDDENIKKYVNQDQFDPVKRLVYGVVTLMLTAIVGSIAALVIKK